MPKPITKEEFRLIKSKLKDVWGLQRNVAVVAKEVGRSKAKVSIIASCKTFEEYETIKWAEHPPVKNSLANRVEELERWRKEEVDPYLSHEQRGRTQKVFDLHGGEHDRPATL